MILDILMFIAIAIGVIILAVAIFAAALYISFKRKQVFLMKFSQQMMTSSVGQKIAAKQMEKMAAGAGMITPEAIQAAMATQGDDIGAQAMGLGVDPAMAQMALAQLSTMDPAMLQSMALDIQKSLEGGGDIDIAGMSSMMQAMGMPDFSALMADETDVTEDAPSLEAPQVKDEWDYVAPEVQTQDATPDAASEPTSDYSSVSADSGSSASDYSSSPSDASSTATSD